MSWDAPHRLVRTAWPVFAACLLLVACGGKAERPGQLMLALTTDMQPIKDFDEITVEVSSFGSVQFKNDYSVDENGLRLPATLGLVVGSKPNEPVTVRVWSSLRGRARTLREVVTTIPTNRVAMLTVKIEWLCLDQVEQDADDEIDSTCPQGQTCIAGNCESSEVDSGTLPDYREQDVFGGGNAEGEGGSCFDTVACFADGYGAIVDHATCSIAQPPEPADSNAVSVALVRAPDSEGICGPEACLVPLDSDGGWTEHDGRIELPPAVCTRLEAGEALGVAVTTACAAKTTTLPTCGLWSSVGTDEGTFDAGAPTLPSSGGGAGGLEEPGPLSGAGGAPGGSVATAGVAGGDVATAGVAGAGVAGGGLATAGVAGGGVAAGVAGGGVVTGGIAAGGVGTGGGATGGTVGDGCTVALFHFDGPNGSTTLTDSSGTGKIAGITGNPSISTAHSRFGGASLYVNGDGNAQTNYVTITGGEDFTLEEDFTVDWWQYAVTYTDTWGGFISVYDGDYLEAGHLTMAWNSGGSGIHFAPPVGNTDYSTGPSNGEWHHAALTRADGMLRGFVDGALVYEYDTGATTLGGSLLRVTGTTTNSDNGDFNGYIDEVRVVKGEAVWTEDFTPPTAPHEPNLTCLGTGGAGGAGGGAATGGAGGATNGLVAYYPFNGNANDESGNGNDGTVNGATLTSDRFGNVDSAYSFNGTSDYINCGNGPDFDITDALTISAWVYTTLADDDQSHTIVSKTTFESVEGDGIEVQYQLMFQYFTGTWHEQVFDYHGEFGLTYYTSAIGFADNISDSRLPLGRWNHIVGRFDGTKIGMYLDGVLDKEYDTQIPQLISNDCAVGIGGHLAGGLYPEYFQGLIDDVRIYNRAISDDEIVALYHENGWPSD